MKQKWLFTLLLVPVLILFLNNQEAHANEIRDRKYVEAQTSSYYNDGKYTGSLSQYLYSGEYIPSASKSVSMTDYGSSTHTGTCVQTSGGTMKWGNTSQTNSNIGSSRYYNDGVYSGTVPRTTTNLVGIDSYGGSCSSPSDAGNGLYDVHNYQAVFSGTVTKPAQDTRVYRYRGWVEAVVSDPSNNQPSPGATTGSTNGRAYWELKRTDITNESDVSAYSSFAITGTHFATRNPLHTLNLGSKNQSSAGSVTLIEEVQTVKGTNVNYSFSYEFTNFFRDIYTCTDNRSGSCYAWVYDKRVPAWDLGGIYSVAGSIPVDPPQKDTISATSLDNLLNMKWIVGKEDTFSPAKQVKTYYEQLHRASDNDRLSLYTLKTQSYIPITPGKLMYDVELPSNAHTSATFEPLKEEGTNGYYQVVDIEDSLKDNYADNKLPLQQSVMKNLGVVGGKRQYELEYVTDLYFMTKHTGFQEAYTYTDDMLNNFKEDVALPSYETLMEQSEDMTKTAFESEMGVSFKDEILFTSTSTDFEKLQRYYIPISPESPLEPQTTYLNKTHIQNVGMNDLTVEFDTAFSFERYLIGSGADNAWIIEQVDDRQSLAGVPAENIHSIKLSDERVEELASENEERSIERVHGFRYADREFTDWVKGLFNLGF